MSGRAVYPLRTTKAFPRARVDCETMLQDDPILVYSRDAARRIDADAIETYGIPGIVLMENAARGAADLACDMLATRDHPCRIVVACGTGNNGGDGWAAARHLSNRGHLVRIATIGPCRPGSDAAINERIAGAMDLTVESRLDLDGSDLIVDALLGTGLDRAVDGRTRDWIEAINAHGAPVLSMDVPSGLDADSGMPLGTAISADRTATFVGWKKGFLENDASRWLGRIHTVEIGIPTTLKERHGHPIDD
ncbi:MAG: NAD(P)H-hydrate epimerase [Phycisphaerales bacterium]|nr:NAD(P)H-hydrate epimerase [Phycisphaerales bacterium]